MTSPRSSCSPRTAPGGAAPAELRERIGELKSSSLLWQLKLGCLRHCRFVHGHHGLEDRAVFPSVRRVAPELGPAIDRLERDHREVATLLVEVEAAAMAIEVDGGRERLVAGSDALCARHCSTTSRARSATSSRRSREWRAWAG